MYDPTDPLSTRTIANPVDRNESNLVVFGLEDGSQGKVTALNDDAVEASAVVEPLTPAVLEVLVVEGDVPRAANDPRERRRRRELGLDQPEIVSIDQNTPSLSYEPVVVQGSVGDFIRHTIGAEGDALLQEGRVVEAFLIALKGRPVVVPLVDVAPQVDAPPVDIEPAESEDAAIAVAALSLPPMTTEVIDLPVAERPRAANDPRMRRRLAAEAQQAALFERHDSNNSQSKLECTVS